MASSLTRIGVINDGELKILGGIEVFNQTEETKVVQFVNNFMKILVSVGSWEGSLKEFDVPLIKDGNSVKKIYIVPCLTAPPGAIWQSEPFLPGIRHEWTLIVTR